MDYPGSLDLLTVGQAGKEETVNALFSAFSPAIAFGRRASTSSGLTWGYYGGVIALADVPTRIANGTLTLDDDSTCYIRLKDSDGTVDFVTAEPTDWPAPNGGYTALYEVTTSGGFCTAWEDFRIAQGPAGPTGATGAAGAAGADGGAVQPCGRLTLTSGTPVTTSDVTGATSIYFTPHCGNSITLWDGAAWTAITFTETTLALGTITSGKNYDVFGYDNTGTLALEALAWTNDTTRATAVTLQDGRYCKSGDKTRLYLGTFRTTSTTTTEDSGGGTTTQVGGKRFLWNCYHRKARPLAVIDTTTSWSYTTDSWRQGNNAAGNQVAFVVGIAEDAVDVSLDAIVSGSNSARWQRVAIGLDGTSPSSKTYPHAYTNSGTIDQTLHCRYTEIAAAGYHYLAWLERGGDGTSNFQGLNAANSGQSGMAGYVMG